MTNLTRNCGPDEASCPARTVLARFYTSVFIGMAAIWDIIGALNLNSVKLI
jgi:hypothetical protein